LSSLRSPESKRGYGHAIDELIEWYCSEPRLSFNKVVVTRSVFTLRIVVLQPAQSTDDSRQYAALNTKRPMRGLLSPEFAAGIHSVKSVEKLACALETG